jgi:hypothetical protein
LFFWGEVLDDSLTGHRFDPTHIGYAADDLFVAQRDHRINSRGAPGGDVAREQSDNGQKQPDRGKRNPVGLTDAKELRLKQARECHSERRAHGEAR